MSFSGSQPLAFFSNLIIFLSFPCAVFPYFIPLCSTIEQAHWIVWRINEALEKKQCCSAAILDISQAFEKVWLTGILYKLRQTLSRKGWKWVHRTLLSHCRRTPRKSPRAIIIPAIHCRPVNLTRIYHSNLYSWYCSASHRQWSSHLQRSATEHSSTCHCIHRNVPFPAQLKMHNAK
jgi:hypothetical protein